MQRKKSSIETVLNSDGGVPFPSMPDTFSGSARAKCKIVNIRGPHIDNSETFNCLNRHNIVAERGKGELRRSSLTKQIVIVMLLVCSFLLYNVVSVNASEPSLTEILNNLGFTNLAQTSIETFPPGTYNITLYAKFAQYYNENELSYYKVNTSNFTVLFYGPEGSFGYVSPPVTKTFSLNYEFGLSLSRNTTLPYRYFTESSKNPNGTQYAEVYRNLDEPSMFLFGFDERTYCTGKGDFDYNDMVFSLQLKHYLNVVSPYDTPSGEGWYYNGTKAFASLANGIIDYGNGTRAMFTGWSGDASGTNHSESEPILMDQNKTAIANWKIQYYLTVTSSYGSPTPTSEWIDKGTSISASVVTPWNGSTGTHYVCTGWTGKGSVPTSGTLSTIKFTMNQPSSITWNWKTQYLLTVLTYPAGLSPQPTRSPIGEPGNGWWYDASTDVTLTAQPVIDYTFQSWNIDGTSKAKGVNPITISMNMPHTATANYSKTVPVGGLSYHIQVQTTNEPLIVYIALVSILTLTLIKTRKKKRTTCSSKELAI